MEFIKKAFPMVTGVQNAIDEVWDQLDHLITKGRSIEVIKTEITNSIETYIKEKIVFAQQEMANLGQKLFRKKHETIMVVGNTMVYDELFKLMVEKKADFTVIVVDTSPKYESRSLL